MRSLGWSAVALCTASALLAALVESMLIPLYAGTVLVPLAPVLAIAGNIALPLLARTAVDRTSVAAAPFVAWLAVVVVLAGVSQSEGDVIYPAGSSLLQLQSYGVVFGGALAGAVTLMVIAYPAAPRSRNAADR
jgi:hypothetical protein